MAKSDNIIDAVNSFVNSLEEEQKNENIVRNNNEKEKDFHKSKIAQVKHSEVRVSKSLEKIPDTHGDINKKKSPEIHGILSPEHSQENHSNENTESSHENHGDGFERLADIVKKSIELITLDKTIRVEPDKDKYRILVYGKDLAVVIGKNGTVMNAFEYLVNLINKRKKLVEKNVVIDIKDYRKNNNEKIKEMAINMAKKALKERKNIALRPMPSHERKIVHNILSKVKNIRTKSRDDEPNRRIVIYPIIKE